MGKQVNNLNFAVHRFCVFMWSLCVVQACECAGVPIYARALGGLRMTASFLSVTTQSLHEPEAHHLANLVGRWMFRTCLLLPPTAGVTGTCSLARCFIWCCYSNSAGPQVFRASTLVYRAIYPTPFQGFLKTSIQTNRSQSDLYLSRKQWRRRTVSHSRIPQSEMRWMDQPPFGGPNILIVWDLTCCIKATVFILTVICILRAASRCKGTKTKASTLK